MATFAPKGNIHGPILPEFVLKKSITAGAKLMYAILCNYASEKDHCWPSQATLAERLSCSVSSIKNYLAELVRENLVIVRKEKYRSSVYYMIRPESLSEGRKVHSDCQQPKFANEQPNSGYLNNFKKQEKEKTPPLPPVEQKAVKPAPIADSPAAGRVSSSLPDFESIWDLYPKKEAKGFARMAWNKLLKSGQLPPLQDIMASIRHFASSQNWQREHGRFVPQLGNWLRGQRWLDPTSVAELEVEKQRQSFRDAMQAQEEREQRELERYRAHKERLRPEFEAFAACFSEPFHHPRALGTWMFLRSQNLAPQASDVPPGNSLGIIDFMDQFKIRRKAASNKAEPSVSTTELRMGEPTICGSLLRHGSSFAHLLSGGRELQAAV